MKKILILIAAGFAVLIAFCIYFQGGKSLRKHYFDTLVTIRGAGDTLYVITNPRGDTINWWFAHPGCVFGKAEYEKCLKMQDSLLMFGYKIGCIND